MNTQNHKVVIITGANSGIGKAAALKFATEGYTVVMACRNRQKSQRVQEEISRLSNNTNIEVMTLDVSSMASITAFCQEFRNTYQKLDILVHNAASFNFGTKQYQFSRDGIELTFATNTFGPLLMNVLLQDLLKKAENPKILNASTININWFHYPKRRIEFDNLQGEHHDTRPYSAYKMYGDSKMSLTMQTFKLAEEFQPDGIAVNALLIPDIHHSKASLKNMSFIPRMLGTLMNPFLPCPDMIAQNYFTICTSKEFDQVTGKLMTHKYDIVEAPKYAYDPKNIDQNWKVSQRIISAWVNP